MKALYVQGLVFGVKMCVRYWDIIATVESRQHILHYPSVLRNKQSI